MEVGWCGSSMLKGTWQDSNNLLGSPSLALSTYASWFRPQTRHEESESPDRFTVANVYMSDICVCMHVWSSRARRGEKCQPASPELESGEIQAGKIRDCVPSILRPCLLMIRTLADIFFSLSLSVCVQNRNKSVDTTRATDYTFVVVRKLNKMPQLSLAKIGKKNMSEILLMFSHFSWNCEVWKEN